MSAGGATCLLAAKVDLEVALHSEKVNLKPPDGLMSYQPRDP